MDNSGNAPCIAPSEMSRFCIPEFMVCEGVSHVRCCGLFGPSDVNLNQTHIRQFQGFSFSTMMQDQSNLSRANSRNSARSRNGSSLSRNQSLIKKNIQLQDLKPADVLIERFVAWKAIVQQLTAYFEVCCHPPSISS